MEHGFLINDRLVRAKHLAQYLGGKIARLDCKSCCVTYVHFLCDKHEIVFTDGSAAESLYPDPLALQTIGKVATMELSIPFPELRKAVQSPEAVKPKAPTNR